VVDVEPEIEASQELHEPLMNKRFRDKDQRPFHTPRQDQPMKNQAGFDRFTKPHFICEQDARSKPARDFGTNVKLMRNEIDASPGESADPRFAAAVLMFQCGHSKIEGFRRIEMTEEEPFLGFVEADPIAEIRLAQFLPAGSIVQNSAALIDRLNR